MLDAWVLRPQGAQQLDRIYNVAGADRVPRASSPAPTPVLVPSACHHEAMELNARNVALMLARGRIVVGAVAITLPGVAMAVAPGTGTGTGSRALGRMLGGRDLALGVGAITSLKERTQDAEWVGMGGAVDIVDGLALLLTPRLPFHARLVGLGALGAGVIGIGAARMLADERVELAEATEAAAEHMDA